MSMAEKKPRTPRMTLSLDPKLAARLDELAKADGRTRSNLIRKILNEWQAQDTAKRGSAHG